MMNMMKLFFVALLLLTAWHNAFSKTPLNLYTVTSQNLSKTLYFDGVVSPIGTVPLLSPTEGNIKKILFTDGQLVQTGQPLIEVSLEKLKIDLRSAQADYLTALDDHNKKKNWKTSDAYFDAQDNLSKAERSLKLTQSTYKTNQTLYQLAIISHDDLLDSQNNYQDALAASQEAQRSLENFIANSQKIMLTISELKLTNAQKKYEQLCEEARHAILLSPATGIVFKSKNTAEKSDGKNSDALHVGAEISYHELLLSIGNTQGLTIKLSVPEVNINELKLEQEATVVGSGFQGMTLTGKVTAIGAQANSSASSAVTTYPVTVTVPALTEDEQKKIRIGMSAQVAIVMINKVGVLTVPIHAVSHNETGLAVVERYETSSRKTFPVVVKTGLSSAQQVEIVSGLSPNEQVVIPA